MTKFFLITTPILETWNFNQDVLMLGSWCRPFDKKENLKELKSYKILDYHWNDSEKVFKDYQYLNEFGERLLSKLYENMNSFHNVSFSKDYWRMISSNWLFSLIHIIFDRWQTLINAFDKFEISHTKIIEIDKKDMVPQSIENLTDIAFQDKWNHYIFSEILKYKYSEKVKIEMVNLRNDSYEKFFQKKFTFKNTILYNFYSIIRKFYFKIFSNEKYFITDTYLGKLDEIILNFKLKNFPITISPRSYFFIEPDFDLRKKIYINLKCNNEFENFFLKILPDLIPCSFLENYKNILNEVKNSKFPKKPKVIFTSHAIDKKTLTSFYIAEKKEMGAKLIHGQHGGGYGQNKFHWYEDFERKISDKFLTWGWKSDERTIPIGILKPQKSLRKIKFEKKKNKLIMIMRPKERYFSTVLDSRIRAPQMLDYHYDCMDMIERLNVRIKNNLILRLHERTYGWYEKDMWKQRFPIIDIDEGLDNIDKSLSASRLSIYTYNSTGYLEFFVANLPTLLFWPNKDNPLNDEANAFFDELKKAKIFHENKESLSLHINEIWDDVDLWWSSNNVQSIRKKFCDKYAKVNNNKINEIKSLIINA